MKREHLSYVAGYVSIVVNTILFGFKYWIGIVTGSVAISADAWHTLSDSITSIIVVTSTRISHKPADDKHPYGHGRIELVAAIVIGVILAMVAFAFFEDAITSLKDHTQVIYGFWAIIVIAASVVVKEALAQFSFWIGNKINSKAIIADGWHHRSDALSSLIVVGGMFLGRYFWWIDGVMGMAVSMLLFKTAYDILKESVSPILGERPDDKLLDKVKKICMSNGGSELEAHHFHLHEYGDHSELTFHIKIEKNKTLQEAHSIANYIEKQIKDDLGIDATIHMEPL